MGNLSYMEGSHYVTAFLSRVLQRLSPPQTRALQNTERRRWYGEETHGDDVAGVIRQECPSASIPAASTKRRRSVHISRVAPRAQVDRVTRQGSRSREHSALEARRGSASDAASWPGPRSVELLAKCCNAPGRKARGAFAEAKKNNTRLSNGCLSGPSAGWTSSIGRRRIPSLSGIRSLSCTSARSAESAMRAGFSVFGRHAAGFQLLRTDRSQDFVHHPGGRSLAPGIQPDN